MEIGGLVRGTQYDAIDVSRLARLKGSLNITFLNGFIPTPGQQFTLLDQAGFDPINGNFTDLPEGAQFFSGGQLWLITYHGGSGNDLLITAVPEPGAFAIVGVAVTAWLIRRHRGILLRL